MSNETARYPQLAKPIRNLKIICGVGITGCVLAMAALLLNVDFGNLKTDLKLIVMLATVSAAALLVVSQVLFKIIVENTAARSGKKSPEHRGFAVVRGAWLIRYVLLVAVFFLNLIIALLENNVIPMLIATAGLLLMLRWFPRIGNVEKALSDHLTG